ncbi:CHAT domain-containing protein [Streptomyces cyaneochromogenes]|uniref:CHAT domain-containing protein n=1 Tax=Streptomyces cyaneochromogenes TaxID=2496836 RepID=A0A3Q9ESH1_9ACTN|nr:CHAT domain-containing protein [Streptomyces cyaneochromogenes]AZQ38073.1 CHAT domain-containing protein [Streptomyces cyaneochromogenes]
MSVSDEESGGVQGLRAWAADAAERVKRLTPAMGARDVPPQAYEPSIAELDELAGLLDHDPVLRSAVSVWLGGALAMRYSAGGGEPADRERAERLLREARDRGTALGAAAGDEHRRWAALFLVSVIAPIRSQQGGYGAVPDLSALVDWFSQAGLAGMAAFNTELEELTAEVLQLPLPPSFLAELRQMQGIFSTPPGAEFTDLLTSMMPAGDPHTDQLRRMMNQMFGMAGAPAGGRTDASGPAAPGPRRSPDAGPSRKPDSSAAPDPDPAPAPDPASGPGLTPDDIRRLAAGLDAMNAATRGLDDVLNSGDPEAFNEILRRLGSVQKNPPPGPDPTAGLEAMRALLLNISSVAGGARQDQAAGRANLQKIVDHFATLEGSAPTGVTGHAVLGRAIALYTRVLDAGESEDVEALRDLVDEAEALEKSVPEDHQFRYMVLSTLGAAYCRLGIVTRDRELMLRALPYMEKGISGVRDSGLPFADEMPLPYIPDIDLVRAGLTGDPTQAHEPVRLPPDASTEDLHRSAHSVAVYYSLNRDPAVLDRLIDELERVRDRVREGRAPRIAAEALWNLAMAYRERDVLNHDVQNIRALEAAQEALTVLAADVLLQSGAEHGLLAARSGASRGVQAALWAASQGRLHEAVAALELGRALVLHAASTSSAVPELLDTGGHHDLAEAWRAADSGRSPAAADDDRVPDELPGRLRRQALEALGYRREGGLLGTPTLSELADGVAESGADALVYLVPCEDGDAGVAIAVSPALGAGLSVRPHLSGAESGPLERYLDATAARDAAARDGGHSDPSVEQTWEEALKALCDWAFQVLGPVLADVDKGLGADGRPLRIVLVPCGRLGLVPWHAARYPDDAPHRYLCETDVISYAASGSQFLRTVGRAPRDPAAAPVLLADPTLDLTHAEVEVMALRDAFYQQARMVGGIFEMPEEELVPGTPDEVLAFLADGASLLHVASHGSAGTRPTVSALHLAAPGSTGGTSAEASGPEPDPGMLTVTRLLDRSAPRRAVEDGPLVVLSACQTDLSTRDHDEALTLTTAFVSGGARDVVGSRWTTNDSASALLMAVFHHHLTVEGLSPVDALRATQQWMLDPHRENPGSLGGELLRQMRRPDLDRISLWAAFIHQGHPGAGRNQGRTNRNRTGRGRGNG